MKDLDFNKICQAVEAGEERYLENVVTRHAGKVLACHGEEVEIDIFGKHETWPCKECEELGRPDFNYHR